MCECSCGLFMKPVKPLYLRTPHMSEEEVDLGCLFAAKKGAKKRKMISLNDEDELKDKTSAKYHNTELEQDEDKLNMIPRLKVEKNSKVDVSSSSTSSDKLDYSYLDRELASTTQTTTTAATAILQTDTEFDRDHRARRQEALDRSKSLAGKGELETTYRGLKGYQQFLMQGDTARANASSDKNRVAGPVRAAANLRVTCRFDYKPDLCKDYNETGFCGFGDSCIFLHDRTEHKSSYQLEKEWDADQKRKLLEAENADHMVKDSSAAVLAKPTDCSICGKAFTRPVKTKCNHYFCEMCVLRKQKCPVCKTALLGSFKPASKELM